MLVCPMKDTQSWSHMSTRTTGGIYQSVQKTALGIRERKKRMAIAKCFALHANTISVVFH